MDLKKINKNLNVNVVLESKMNPRKFKDAFFKAADFKNKSINDKPFGDVNFLGKEELLDGINLVFQVSSTFGFSKVMISDSRKFFSQAVSKLAKSLKVDTLSKRKSMGPYVHVKFVKQTQAGPKFIVMYRDKERMEQMDLKKINESLKAISISWGTLSRATVVEGKIEDEIKKRINTFTVADDPYEVAKEIGNELGWSEKQIEKAEKIIRRKYLK